MYLGYKLHDKCLQKQNAAFVRSTPKTRWWHWIAMKNWASQGSAVTANWIGDITEGSDDEVRVTDAQ